MKTFEIDKAFEIISGQPRRNDTSVFAVVRDEMYFLPAFLRHYRKLGYDQFVFLDDFSEDGTFEFLLNQNDCVVLRSSYRYGEPIKTDHFKKGKLNRAGIYLKYLIQTMLFEGHYITHVDADEFLILPSRFNGISDLVDYLKNNDIRSLHASSIEFFPENISSIYSEHAPQTFAEIISQCPYFDNTRLLELRASPNHRDVATIMGQSASSRLFERESIRDLRLPWADLPQFLLQRLPLRTAESHVIKTPIAFRDKESKMAGSHYANVPATTKVSVALAHFVFTSNLPEKIAKSLAWKSHARGATKYVSYSKLLAAMKGGNGSFLGPQSERYVNVRQLEKSGLIVEPD